MSVTGTVPSPFVAQFDAEDVMTRSTRRILLGLALAATTASVVVPLLAQQGGTMTHEQARRRWELRRNCSRSRSSSGRSWCRCATASGWRRTSIGRRTPTGKVGDRLRQDALQLQLLGRPQPRAVRHDGGADGGEARLCLRRPERARTFLLRGQLRHPRAAGDRRVRCAGVVVEADLVERQGRRDRMLVDRRVSAGVAAPGIRRSRR